MTFMPLRLTGNFRQTAALAAIKRKKMHTSHLTSTQSQIATLEQQMHAVETANLNVETLKVMKSASNAMKVIHGGMNVDKVDETMYVLYFSCHMRLVIGMLDGGRRLDFPRTADY